MEKYIYDENNGMWYELQGDYYIPCLKLPDEELMNKNGDYAYMFNLQAEKYTK
jgi:hypothetical protein